jgi:flagellar biogenesis protein FliO
MNKYLFLLAGTIIFSAQKALCAVEAVSPELQHSLKSTANEPNFLTIIFALLVVVFLIYITGLIYSKLNIVGAKTVQEQLRHHDLSKVIVLSTTQLGQNKNLHVIELDHKRYLIGATANSINLIKELGEFIKTEAKKPAKSNTKDPINVLYGDEEENPELKLEDVKEFDVHKKYL